MQSGLFGFPVKHGPFQGQGFDVYTSSGTWVWPSGVFHVKVRAVGGGGGSGSTGRTNGGDTTVDYNGITYTAGGGAYGSSGGTASGGSTTNFPLGVSGGSCTDTGAPSLIQGGSSLLGIGGMPGSAGSGYGAGGGPDTGAVNFSGGAGGGYGEVVLTRQPGQDTVSVVIGTAGTAGTSGYAGTAGVVIFEYDVRRNG